MNEEQQTIREVVGGRTDRFRLLVERYQRPLAALARNLIGDAHEAEDIVQEVFIAAYSNLARFDARRAKFSTWLFAIAKNRCVNHQQRRRPQLAGEAIQNVAASSADEPPEEEFFKRLDAALAQLPLEQRTAFVLAEIHGLSYDEVAAIEQTKQGTIKSRISRAKEKLRAALRSSVEQSS